MYIFPSPPTCILDVQGDLCFWPSSVHCSLQSVPLAAASLLFQFRHLESPLESITSRVCVGEREWPWSDHKQFFGSWPRILLLLKALLQTWISCFWSRAAGKRLCAFGAIMSNKCILTFPFSFLNGGVQARKVMKVLTKTFRFFCLST